MRYLIFALLLLAGCNEEQQLVSHSEAEDIADDISADNDAAIIARVEALEERLGKAEDGISGVRALGIENAENADRTSAVVSNNAKVANQNALREMTSRGACGQDWVQLENGGFMTRNRECTEADFRK